MTQTDQVLSFLMEHGSITPLDAIESFGIMRLGARIWDLRASGIPIKTTKENKINRYGKTVHYARYVLEDFDA